MNRRAKLFIFLIGIVVVFAITTFKASAQSQLNEQSKVSIDGIGSVRVGMTIAQSEESARVSFVEDKGGRASPNCYYVKPQPEVKGVGFMVISDRNNKPIDRERDRIARVDVSQGSRVTTVSGAKIGDTEARIESLYPGQIKVTPHAYNRNGHYLTFVPQNPQDRNYRLVFETAHKRVTGFRAGRLPEVEYIEGCA